MNKSMLKAAIEVMQSLARELTEIVDRIEEFWSITAPRNTGPPLSDYDFRSRGFEKPVATGKSLGKTLRRVKAAGDWNLYLP